MYPRTECSRTSTVYLYTMISTNVTQMITNCELLPYLHGKRSLKAAARIASRNAEFWAPWLEYCEMTFMHLLTFSTLTRLDL